MRQHTETVTWLAQIRLSWTYLLAPFSRQMMQHNIQEMKWLCVNEASKWVEWLQARKRQIGKLRKWCHPPFFGREGLGWVEQLKGSRWLVSECVAGQWETGMGTGKEAWRPWPVMREGERLADNHIIGYIDSLFLLHIQYSSAKDVFLVFIRKREWWWFVPDAKVNV